MSRGLGFRVLGFRPSTGGGLRNQEVLKHSGSDGWHTLTNWFLNTEKGHMIPISFELLFIELPLRSVDYGSYVPLFPTKPQ